MSTTQTEENTVEQDQPHIEWLVSCYPKDSKNKPQRVHSILIWASTGDLAMEAAVELGEAGPNLRAKPHVRPGHKIPLTFDAWCDMDDQNPPTIPKDKGEPKEWLVSSMRHPKPLRPKCAHTCIIWNVTADDAMAEAVALGLAEYDATLTATPI